jgi:hypothetical protein
VCFACLGTSLQLDGSSRLVLSWGLRATRGSVAAAAPASRCRATCWLLPCRALPWGLHGDLLGRGQRRGRLLGCGRPGRLAVGAVGGVRRAGAGRWACASRSGARSALLLPPGDPELPAPQRCRLAPWDRSLLHRVAPSQVSAPARVGAVRLERLKARSPTLVGRPCRLAWSVARRDRRLARGIAAGPATVKPGQPSGRRSDRCADVVAHHWLHPGSGVHVDQPARSATAATKIPMPEHHSAQLVCRWARRAHRWASVKARSSRCTCQ